jgi:hypothetical protein
MAFALIRNSDNAWLAGPLEQQPSPGAGERAIEVALGYPERVAWSPAKGGFVDIVTASPLLTVGRFKLLFTYQERAALRAAAQSSDLIADFLDLLNGFTDGVALDDPVLVASIQALVPAGLLTAARAEQVLAGISPA